MINKVFSNVKEALYDLHDGASIMVGGFNVAGTPYNLVQGLVESGVKNLTLIANSFNNFTPIMKDGSHVKKVLMSFPVSPFRWSMHNPFKEGIMSGEIQVEIVPQGTLATRIWAGGSGIPAFYTPTGVGTAIERGKEKKIIDGKEYIMEKALKADFAFIKAYKADTKGNLIYRMAMRNFNPVMAMAARVTVIETEFVVEAGEIDPDAVVTPGIFVDRIVQVKPFKIIDFKKRQKEQMEVLQAQRR